MDVRRTSSEAQKGGVVDEGLTPGFGMRLVRRNSPLGQEVAQEPSLRNEHHILHRYAKPALCER